MQTVSILVVAVLALFIAFTTKNMDAEKGSFPAQTGSTLMSVVPETTGLTMLLGSSAHPSATAVQSTTHLPKSSDPVTTVPSTSLGLPSVTPAATTRKRDVTTTKPSTKVTSVMTTVKPTTVEPTPARTTVASTTRSTTTVPVAESTPAATTQPAPVSTTIVRPTVGSSKGMVVVIDPGHQSVPDYDTEPLYPGSTILKAKCSAGTRGVFTRRYEYVVNLEISLRLKTLLESQGVQVYLTRSRHDVRMSNIERALFAEGKHADVFIRIHCNGSNDPTVQGVKTYVGITGTYADKLPQWGQQLSCAIAATTGATDLGVDVSNRYTGLNWSDQIPAFLLETGFMSNPDEDRQLSDSAYQDLICQGIADFVSRMPDL